MNQYCIGQLLFTVYINDVCTIFDADTKCKLYANDAKLFSEIVTGDDRTRLHENLDALTRLPTDWQLAMSSQNALFYTLARISTPVTL